MLDRVIHNWWLWLGRALVAVALWYGYEGLEVDSRHADALDRIDEQGLEIDNEIEDVENELQNVDSQAQRVRVSAKLVKLEKKKSQFLNESMHKSVGFYVERQSTMINFLIFFLTAVLVWSVVPKVLSCLRRWRNQRRLLAASREEGEGPVG
jgi:hypothetical protein